MGVHNGSLTEGDGKEHLSSSPSSVCRSSWPWFCKICAVGCLKIAGLIDSWRRIATAGRFAVEDVLFISDCSGMDLPTEGFEHGP